MSGWETRPTNRIADLGWLFSQKLGFFYLDKGVVDRDRMAKVVLDGELAVPCTRNPL